MGNTFGTTPASGATYAGRYTDSAEVTTFLGSMNITVQTDNDGTSNADAIQQGIVSAEARVDLHTGGPYTFAATTAGTVAAQVFAQWAYKLAAYEYAAKRGFEGNSENEFKRVQDEVIAEMKMLRDGDATLPGATPPTGTADDWSGEAPIAVAPTVDGEGRTISDPPPVGAYWDGNRGVYRWS